MLSAMGSLNSMDILAALIDKSISSGATNPFAMTAIMLSASSSELSRRMRLKNFVNAYSRNDEFARVQNPRKRRSQR